MKIHALMRHENFSMLFPIPLIPLALSLFLGCVSETEGQTKVAGLRSSENRSETHPLKTDVISQEKLDLELFRERFFFGDYDGLKDIESEVGSMEVDKDGRVRAFYTHSRDEEKILEVVRASPFLIKLDVAFAKVSEEVVIAASLSCPILEEIELGQPEDTSGEPVIFTNRSLEALSKLNRIRSIGVRSNSISDEGIRYLRELPFLEKLDVSGSEITDDSLKTFKKLMHLNDLAIFDTKLSKEALDDFSKARPEVKIRKTEVR